ncbi:hypothetical protein TIFTF001_030463 [Ficus carica]|uniref:Uncharacterized protein n=1 Tax=Ficus carica TaxID=3494 RepID=A0AA88DTV6_FICCA|nr:hypothetical protein TIFTF001_030463 [Ficus carica]
MASNSLTVPQGGGSHENDHDLVGHSSTRDLVAEGCPNPNPSLKRPSVACDVKFLFPRRRRSGDGPPDAQWKVGEGGEE